MVASGELTPTSLVQKDRLPLKDGYEHRSNKSIEKETGLKRRPAPTAINDNEAISIGEAARTNADGSLVPREREKQGEYIDAGISDRPMVKIPKKPSY